MKLFVKCSLKSFIAFASQLEDFFLGYSGVKNSSYFSSITPLWMIILLVYCNDSFLGFSSLLFLTSQPLVDPYNITHISIYCPCKKLFIYRVHSLLKKTINAIKTWFPIFSWNQHRYPFIGTCILIFWCRLLMLDPIMFPTNQPIGGE